ncbi:hypothetical protein ACQEXU_11345 [Vibrio sp. TRT 21S02]|uniref:hypothetical protein n=1 Tax=Vibrio sp. TRT 21S02 TaxID=3418507 RepID=UPI003CEE8AB4
MRGKRNSSINGMAIKTESFNKWVEKEGKYDFNDGFDLDSRAKVEELYDIWKTLGKPRGY